MTGQNIVCFAKDWSEHPTSNNHIMLELAKHNRVLWLNSVATRAPKLGNGRDLKKIFTKLASFARGVRRIQENLWVYTPIVLPLPHSEVAAGLNRRIMRLTIKMLTRKLRMNEYQLWTFLPSTSNYVGALGESLVVYYCVDEWSQFNYLNGKKTAEAERRLVTQADVVFTSARSLMRDRQALNHETHLSPHGVDHAAFATALDDATPIPDDIAALPRPIVGFYGTIQDWVDLELVARLARRHPEWSIALVGKPVADVSRLADIPNVHLLGGKPHSDLPRYCKAFAVGLIPYVMNERIRHVNPIKLREYLSAGVPVVSVPLPEVLPYRRHCAIAEGYEQFEQAIIRAIREDSPQARRERSEAMRPETWSRRVLEIGSHVMRVKEKLRTGAV